MKRDHQDAPVRGQGPPFFVAVGSPNYIIRSQVQRVGAAAVMDGCSRIPPHAERDYRTQGEGLDTREEVLAVLDDVLSLKGRAAGFGDSMPLLGSVPELDSMAVANVLTSLEDRFGFTIDDDEIDGSTFESVASLVAFVRGKLETVR
jgi:acyl carrier protein